jgi:hypothetical protein
MSRLTSPAAVTSPPGGLRERCLHGRQVALLQGGHDVLDAEGEERDYSAADVKQRYFVQGLRRCAAAVANALQPHEWGRPAVPSPGPLCS